MPTNTVTIPCPCCGGCCNCSAYCFSRASTVTATWAVTPVGGDDPCKCAAGVTAGSQTLPFSQCDGAASISWLLAGYLTVTCDAVAYVLDLQASFNCTDGTWSFGIAAESGGDPYILFDGVTGDGCGAMTTGFTSGGGVCPFTLGTLTLTVNANNCCRDAISGDCANGTPACDGTCNPLP